MWLLWYSGWLLACCYVVARLHRMVARAVARVPRMVARAVARVPRLVASVLGRLLGYPGWLLEYSGWLLGRLQGYPQ